MNEDFLFILESQFYGSPNWVYVSKSKSARDICKSLEYCLGRCDNRFIYRITTKIV